MQKFEDVCRDGDGDLEVKKLLMRLNFWNWGLRMACKIGDKEIVELMIKNGANDWNEGLGIACRGEYKEIMELMIEKGANNHLIKTKKDLIPNKIKIHNVLKFILCSAMAQWMVFFSSCR